MLDAIADFWKPVKRLQAQNRLKPEELQIGSVISFGHVPQPSLSNRTLSVSGINTYKFGPDVLTSFVLAQDKEAGASMIIAEAKGEQYIAMSRRMSISDRNRIFVHEDIEAVIKNGEAEGIKSREVTNEYKGWVAPYYKREIHGVKGQLFKGDHRAGLVTGQQAAPLDFSYTLLVSDNNEHALEMERYEDGRVEVYATVYRRLTDVVEVTHPNKDTSRPDVKMVSNGAANPTFKPAPKPEPKMGEGNAPKVPERTIALETKPLEAKPLAPAPKVEPQKEPEVIAAEERKADVQPAAVTAPVALPEFAAKDVVKKEEAPVVQKAAPQPSAPEITKYLKEPSASVQEEAPETKTAIIIKSEQQPYTNQEIKAVNKETSNFVNESIDCELHVANKIIDEAIRNEMRINDVVRRVIGLPVSQQESVQIPVTLTDQDYALLAIRYGISGTDHDAIKRRITEDLNDFSGSNKTKKAA